MKRKSLIIFFLLLPTVSALFAQETTVLRDLQKEGADHDGEREEWVRQMHRAAPDVDPERMDFATREAKYQALQLRTHNNFFSPQSVSLDTIAGGALTGSWLERGSSTVSGRMITEDIDFDNNIIYAASAMGNIWKASLDNTNQWTSLNDHNRFGDVRMLKVVTTSKGKRLIAVANGPAAVHYSDDGGATWQTATGLDGPRSWGSFRRAILTGNSQTIYLCGNEWDNANGYAISTLYRSNDQGKTFSNVGKWKTNSNLCDIWAAHLTANSVYFVRADSLFHIGATGPITFVAKMTYSTAIGSVGNLHIQGAEKNNTTTLAVMETTNSVGTITESTNGGTSWKKTGTFSGDLFNDNSFKILASDPKTMAAGTIEVFISHDNGATWNHINSWGEYYGDEEGKLHADIDGIDFIEDAAGNEVQLFSTDGGIFMSSDTLQSYHNLTLAGIGTSQYYSVLTSRKAPYYIYGGSQDQGYQRALDTVNGPVGTSQTISGDYGHVTSSNGGLSTWCDYPGFAMLYANAETSTANRTWSFQGNNHLWMAPIIADPENPQAAYIASGGDANQSYIWHLVNGTSGLAASHLAFDFSQGISSRQASAIGFSPLDHSRMYVLSNDGEVFYSTNTGTDWTQSNFSSAPATHYFYGSVILPSVKDSKTLWIAGSGYSNPGVFVSTDGGVSFTAIDSNAPKTMFYSLAATDDEQFLFAATDVGPYVCDLSTGIWYDMSQGHAPDMVYWSVDYIPALKTVRFGTYGRGIWDFVIGGAPTPHSYTISSPKGGDTLISGTKNYTIKYTSVNPGLQQNFRFSSDGGKTLVPLVGTPGVSTFTWSQVPDSVTTKGVIVISDELGTSGSSGNFTIMRTGVILTLTISVTNSHIASSKYLTMNWTTNGGYFASGFTAEYSIDSGATWHAVAAVPSNILQVTWLTPQGYFPHCFVRVRRTDDDKAVAIQKSSEFVIGQPAGVDGSLVNDLHLVSYPNPASTTTTFKYYLPEPGKVSLSIYDVSGKEVERLIANDAEDIGDHSIDFNASKLASGSYTYILISGQRRAEGTMTIMR
jgi:hypothetical protein